MPEARRRLLLQVPQKRPRVHSLSPRGWLIPTSPREVRWARCCLWAWKKTSSAWLSAFLGHLNTVQCLSPSLKLLPPVSHPAVISDPSTNASQTWHLQAPAAQTGVLEPGCPPATGFAWSFYHCVLNPILTFETFLLPWTVHLSQLCVSTFIDFFSKRSLSQARNRFLSFFFPSSVWKVALQCGLQMSWGERESSVAQFPQREPVRFRRILSCAFVKG